MRIDRLEGYLLRLPLKRATRFCDETIDRLDTLVVRVVSDGLSGWGEAAPGNSPLLTSEWTGASFLALRDQIAPRVLAEGAFGSCELLENSYARVRGARAAKSAVEIAWRDLTSRAQGLPLWKALGGEKKTIKVGLTFDRAVEREEFFTELQRAVDDQFGRVSLKMRPGWDVQIVSFARVDYPSWLQLVVDVEGELDYEKHADTLYRMDDFSLVCLEQPLNPRDFVAHAQLNQTIRTPICLDESILSLSDADIAFDLESCDVVCLKPQRMGGLSLIV